MTAFKSPFSLASSTRMISCTSRHGDRLMMLQIVRSRVDHASLWNTITMLVLGNLSTSYVFRLQLQHMGQSNLTKSRIAVECPLKMCPWPGEIRPPHHLICGSLGPSKSTSKTAPWSAHLLFVGLTVVTIRQTDIQTMLHLYCNNRQHLCILYMQCSLIIRRLSWHET